MTIHILDPTVAAQIAAGEVVERPASVVKEMVENALDAQARSITVEARGGGLREIKVQDDGCGIPADQVELAFTRHATSKLRSADDLWNINTLGFRGEALPSIASVAQVACITRTASEETGTELRIAGGEIQARMPRGCSPGTSMSIRHLFYNTPVRRDYLRSDSTEMSAISLIVQQYALAYPDVRFSLLLDGKLALQTSGNGNLRDVLIEVYGLDVARQLLPVDMQQGEGTDTITIQGMISPPGLTRSSRGYLHIYVNRRAVQARSLLGHIIEEAYHTLLMKGKHPLAVLNIQVHPETVDVNVHPTKSDVRFRHQSRVTGVLGRAIRDALIEGAGVQSWADMTSDPEGVPRRFEVRQSSQEQQQNPPEAGPAWRVARSAWNTQYSRWDVGGGDLPYASPAADDEPLFPDADASANASTTVNPDVTPDMTLPAASNQHHATPPGAADSDLPPAPDTPMDVDEATPPDPAPPATEQTRRGARIPPLRVVGQVGMTYIVTESPNGMYLVDQHAAHERIAYERLMAQRGHGAIESQELLMPQTVELSPEAAQMLLGNADALAEWGFTLEPWGEGMVRVRAVPAILQLENLQTALLEITDYLKGEGGSTPDDWREAMLTTLSCHTSVRAGQSLELEEMRTLLRQLEQCTNPHTCPHGRPTMILLTPDQLERQFGRQP
jgi:DNA mismatch repair protein MutL